MKGRSLMDDIERLSDRVGNLRVQLRAMEDERNRLRSENSRLRALLVEPIAWTVWADGEGAERMAAGVVESPTESHPSVKAVREWRRIVKANLEI